MTKRFLGSVAIVALALVGPVAFAGAAHADGGNSTNAHLCQHGGWQTLVRADDTSFANEGDCVSYGAHGGTPMVSLARQACDAVGGVFGNDDQTGATFFTSIAWTCNDWTATYSGLAAKYLLLDAACSPLHTSLVGLPNGYQSQVLYFTCGSY